MWLSFAQYLSTILRPHRLTWVWHHWFQSPSFVKHMPTSHALLVRFTASHHLSLHDYDHVISIPLGRQPSNSIVEGYQSPSSGQVYVAATKASSYRVLLIWQLWSILVSLIIATKEESSKAPCMLTLVTQGRSSCLHFRPSSEVWIWLKNL